MAFSEFERVELGSRLPAPSGEHISKEGDGIAEP